MATSSESKSLLEYNNLHIDSDLQVVIVYTEWNEKIIAELIRGVQHVLSKFPSLNVYYLQVPGAIEITNACFRTIELKRAQVIIALGCVIKGETPHFDYVCQSVTQGITHLNATQSIPVIFGVLTVNSVDEAWDRLGGKHGHKGEEAAIAALKMCHLNYQTSIK